MRALNIFFTDEEFKQLLEKKKRTGRNWHDFFLWIAGVEIKEVDYGGVVG